MNQKQKSLRHHTEQGVIDILHEFGYIETTDDGATWFTKAGSEYILDRQLDLKDILTECTKTYKYLERMGKDVYEVCRSHENGDAVQILNAVSDALHKKKTYRRGILLGIICGIVGTVVLISILRLHVQLGL